MAGVRDTALLSKQLTSFQTRCKRRVRSISEASGSVLACSFGVRDTARALPLCQPGGSCSPVSPRPLDDPLQEVIQKIHAFDLAILTP